MEILNKETTDEFFVANGPRKARIIFVDQKFRECQFDTQENPYNFQDWRFLEELAAKIVEIADSYLKRERE